MKIRATLSRYPGRTSNIELTYVLKMCHDFMIAYHLKRRGRGVTPFRTSQMAGLESMKNAFYLFINSRSCLRTSCDEHEQDHEIISQRLVFGYALVNIRMFSARNTSDNVNNRDQFQPLDLVEQLQTSICVWAENRITITH